VIATDPITGVQRTGIPSGSAAERVGDASSYSTGANGSVAGAFADILRDLDGNRAVQISGHALRRLEQRGIAPPAEHAERLSKAFDTLAAKGGRQSLVMLDSVAYVVRVPERTIVTAVGPDADKERVFTQIDSVLVA
jgi:flagellar operon protein